MKLYWLVLAILAAPATLAEDQQDAPAGTERLSRLQGSTYVDRRTNVVGAVAVVQPEDDPSRLFITSTDDRGAYHIAGLPDGTYRIALTRDGFAPVVKHDINLRFPFRAVVEVVMQPTDRPPTATPASQLEPPSGSAGVQGSVTERDAGPIGEVRVRFVHPQGLKDPFTMTTGPLGRFEIPELEAGTWRMEASGVGFLPIYIELDLAGQTRIDLSLVRQPVDYKPSPLELMPPERVVPPGG